MTQDGAALRRAFSCYPSGVSVITTINNLIPRGITVSSFSSLSLSPSLCMYALESSARRYNIFTEAEFFAVCILSKDQADVATQFSKSDDERVWNKFGYVLSDKKALPVINGIKAYFECKMYKKYDGGDHSIVIGEVIHHVVIEDKSPLVYGLGKYGEMT